MAWPAKALLAGLIPAVIGGAGIFGYNKVCPRGICPALIAPSSYTLPVDTNPNTGIAQPNNAPQNSIVNVPGMGNVPEGTYTAYFNMYSSPVPPYYAGQNTGWVRAGPVALTGPDEPANMTWIQNFSTTYNNNCNAEAASVSTANSKYSCTATPLPWNGSYFGIVFSGPGTKVQLVFAKPGYAP